MHILCQPPRCWESKEFSGIAIRGFGESPNFAIALPVLDARRDSLLSTFGAQARQHCRAVVIGGRWHEDCFVNGAGSSLSPARSSDMTRSATAARTFDPTDARDALDAAVDGLLQRQNADGSWCFELEADCTIPSEYILMMHFMNEIDIDLESRLANYVRARQAEYGGWSLYPGGDFDMSCSVKAYYALKLTGEDLSAEPMQRARAAILQHGGATHSNVFTRITLALFGQVPWRAVPVMPVEIMVPAGLVAVFAGAHRLLVAYRDRAAAGAGRAQAAGGESSPRRHT